MGSSSLRIQFVVEESYSKDIRTRSPCIPPTDNCIFKIQRTMIHWQPYVEQYFLSSASTAVSIDLKKRRICIICSKIVIIELDNNFKSEAVYDLWEQGT